MSIKKTPGKYGNPQLNIRLEPEIMEQIEEKAQSNGVGKQEWVKRLILEALGKEITTAIGRSEFEAAIADLTEKIESIKKSPVAA